MAKNPSHFSFGRLLANLSNHGTTTKITSHTSPSLPVSSSDSTPSSGAGFVSNGPDSTPTTSSSTLSASSLGENSLRSSDFPSPSSTAATSTRANDTLVRFSKLYVSCDARPNQHQRDGYENSLRPCLDEQIAQHTYGQKYAIELLSAGLTPDNLRLAVVISCPEAQTKKSIQSLLKRDKWLKSELLNYRLDLHVVYCNIGLAAGPQAHFSKQLESSQDPYLQLRADASTLCGQSVHISASDGQPAKRFSFTVSLLVGTELRGLYPAHPLLKGDCDAKMEQAPRSESPPLSEDDDSLEPFSLFYDSDNSTMSGASSPRSFLVPNDQIEPLSLLYNPDAEDNASYPATRFPPYETNLIDTSLVSTFPTMKQEPTEGESGLRCVKVAELRVSDSTQRTTNAGLDYTLADLDRAVAEVGLDLVTDNTVDGEVLTEFHRGKPDCSTPIVVASPHATVHGHLRPSSVVFRADEVSYHLRLVELEQPLQRGASGSPVACGNKLCGFIAAVREGLPWAYMISIDGVIADIEAVYGVKVSLPTATQRLVKAETLDLDCLPALKPTPLHDDTEIFFQSAPNDDIDKNIDHDVTVQSLPSKGAVYQEPDGANSSVDFGFETKRESDHSADARSRIIGDEFDISAAELSKQFEKLLRTRRLNDLEVPARPLQPQSPRLTRRHSQQSHSSSPFPKSQVLSQSPRPSSPPPTYTSVRSLPIIPTPPQDATSLKFRDLLVALSMSPTKYENPGLLDDALTHVPIDQIYGEAEEEHNLMKSIAMSKGKDVKPEWGYQDCVIRSLLR